MVGIVGWRSPSSGRSRPDSSDARRGEARPTGPPPRARSSCPRSSARRRPSPSPSAGSASGREVAHPRGGEPPTVPARPADPSPSVEGPLLPRRQSASTARSRSSSSRAAINLPRCRSQERPPAGPSGWVLPVPAHLAGTSRGIDAERRVQHLRRRRTTHTAAPNSVRERHRRDPAHRRRRPTTRAAPTGLVLVGELSTRGEECSARDLAWSGCGGRLGWLSRPARRCMGSCDEHRPPRRPTASSCRADRPRHHQRQRGDRPGDD